MALNAQQSSVLCVWHGLPNNLLPWAIEINGTIANYHPVETLHS